MMYNIGSNIDLHILLFKMYQVIYLIHFNTYNFFYFQKELKFSKR
jgi:hypothetical protein